jgi:hypothetical protein
VSVDDIKGVANTFKPSGWQGKPEAEWTREDSAQFQQEYKAGTSGVVSLILPGQSRFRAHCEAEESWWRRRALFFYMVPEARRTWLPSDWDDFERHKAENTPEYQAYAAGDFKTYRDKGAHVVLPMRSASVTV